MLFRSIAGGNKKQQYTSWEAFSKNVANPLIQTYLKGKETFGGLMGEEPSQQDLDVSRRSARESAESAKEHPFAGGAGSVTGYVLPAVTASVTGGAPLAMGTMVAQGGAEANTTARAYGATPMEQLGSGVVGSVFSGAGVGVPATVTGPAAKRFIYGAGSNAALNYAEAQSQNKILENYPELQRDPELAALIGAGIGGPVGVLVGSKGGKTSPSMPANEAAAFENTATKPAEDRVVVGEEGGTNISTSLAKTEQDIAAKEKELGRSLSAQEKQSIYEANLSSVDKEIAAKQEPAMGAVERAAPTEEQGLTPARSEDVLAAQARENQEIGRAHV